MRLIRKVVASVFVMSIGVASAVTQEDVRIVNEGGIRDSWMLADGVSLAAPGYPGQFVERSDSVCLAMGYAINPDGTTSDFSLLKKWNSSTGIEEPVEGFWGAFTQAGANALSQWKFKPRPEVAHPSVTYTVATLFFNGRDGVDTNSLRQHCKIDDLKALIEQDKELNWAQRRDMESMHHRATPGRSAMDNPTPWQSGE